MFTRMRNKMENNNLKSLKSAFNEKIFRIPIYQRGYAWTTNELNEFWDDLVNLPEGEDHYFGMLTLREITDIDQNPNWNDERWVVNNLDRKAVYVVDGQQRLTTTIIMISVIVKCCEKNGISSLSSMKIEDIKKHFLWLTEPKLMYKTYVFGYEKDNPSYDFFKAKILGQEEDAERSDIIETYYTLNLENAKDFFEKKINLLYKKGGEAALEKIYQKLTQRMMVNTYNITDDFSVYVTFESMNNRGKQLSVLELLKNRLIYLATLIAKVDSNERHLMEEVNNAWKDIYEYLGKDKLRPLEDDKYLRDHWIVYFGYQTKSNYKEFLLDKYFSRKRVAGYDSELGDILGSDEEDEEESEVLRGNLTSSEIQNYVQSIKKMVKYWYALYSPDDKLVVKDEELKTILERLSRLGYEYFVPLSMVILSKKLTPEQKVDAMTAIERYIFLYFRLGGSKSSTNRNQFYRLARDYYYDKVTYEDVMSALNDVEYVQDGILRTDLVYAKTFQDLFEKRDGYYSWGNNGSNLRYFLYEYEINLKDKNHAAMKMDPKEFFKADDRDKVSIEHIYPQTPQGTWIELFEKHEPEERKRLTGTLGNLLPLSQSVNSELQNDDFSEKKKRYLENSHSAVNVAIPLDEDGELLPYEDWTPERIYARGIEMLNFMAKHWKFSFRNEYDMAKLLGITFMTDEEEESWEEFEAARGIHEQKEGGKRRKITDEVIREAYAKAKEVYEGRMSMEAALDYLENFGNRDSMAMYIYAFESMMLGKNYTMAINSHAIDYYVENLLKDYGEGVKENIIKTMKERVRRYKGGREKMKEEEIVRKLELAK